MYLQLNKFNQYSSLLSQTTKHTFENIDNVNKNITENVNFYIDSIWMIGGICEEYTTRMLNKMKPKSINIVFQLDKLTEYFKSAFKYLGIHYDGDKIVKLDIPNYVDHIRIFNRIISNNSTLLVNYYFDKWKKGFSNIHLEFCSLTIQPFLEQLKLDLNNVKIMDDQKGKIILVDQHNKKCEIYFSCDKIHIFL